MKRTDFDCLETQSLNQDPLDSTFGVLHLYCGSKNNPTVRHYVDDLKSGIINGLVCTVMHNVYCEGDNTALLVNLHSFLKESHASTPSPSTSHSRETLHDGLGGSHIAEQVHWVVNVIDMNLFSVAYVSGYIVRHALCAVRCDDCK